jgi:hypothetical protein
MLPTIYTAAADGTHIHAPAAMSEFADSNNVDFQGLASKVADKLSTPAEGVGMARQILTDMLDDILGRNGSAKA